MDAAIRVWNLYQQRSSFYGFANDDERDRLSVWIKTSYDGVAWRGLHPLLFDAPLPVTRRAVTIFVREFRSCIPSIRQRHYTIVRDDANDGSENCRQIFIPILTNIRSIDIWIVPPQFTRIQYYFSGLLIHYEHLWLTLQSLSAWIATLGGGYFLCRHLKTAVRMARQQRALAIWMFDYDTADRCTLNEAFNYIHAGQFRLARRLIRAVQESSRQRNDTLTLRMVHSARLFLHRVKRSAKFFAREKDDTVDDYQRIRIAGDRSRHQRGL
jgi:hypothetical protein